MQAYPWENNLIHDDARLSRPKQACLRRGKVIQGKTSLSAAMQRYPRQNDVIQDKTRLSAEK
jgi:hypothetical protein